MYNIIYYNSFQLLKEKEVCIMKCVKFILLKINNMMKEKRKY